MAVQVLEQVARVLRGVFPHIGPRASVRMALQILQIDKETFNQLLDSMKTLRASVVRCGSCQNLTQRQPCDVCCDPSRTKELLCVVENQQDVDVIEASHSYQGLYHVLHGVLDPKFETRPNFNGTKNLTLDELWERLAMARDFREVILALDTDTEGELTALYIHQELKRRYPHLKVTRLGVGLPFGGEVLYADSLTLKQALERRTVLEQKIGA